jgi:hypothetical protein
MPIAWLGREDSNFCMVDQNPLPTHVPSKPWGFFRYGVSGVKATGKISNFLLRIDWLSCPNGALLW